MKGQTERPREHGRFGGTSKDGDLTAPVDKSEPDPRTSQKRKRRNQKGKKNQTENRREDKNAMAMISYEGTTRDGSAINLDDTKGITDTKESGTQTEERRLMQLGIRGLAIISMKVMLVGLLVLTLLPKAAAFTELLQQSPGNWASQMLA